MLSYSRISCRFFWHFLVLVGVECIVIYLPIRLFGTVYFLLNQTLKLKTLKLKGGSLQ